MRQVGGGQGHQAVDRVLIDRPVLGQLFALEGSGDLGQQWTATAHGGYKTASVQPGQPDRCLTNGDGGKSGGSMTVHVYLARSIYVATDRTYICCL